MPNVMASAAIVADQPVIRRGLESILTGAEFTVARSVGSAAELPRPAEVDLVLLTTSVVRHEPLVATITGLCPSARVLVVSGSPSAIEMMAAIRAGASGYLSWQAEERAIRSAAHTVVAGGLAVCGELTTELTAESTAAPMGPVPVRPIAVRQVRRPGRPPLSPREREALVWIAKGLTHAQAAARMRVSKPTVDTYVARIRVKLQLGNKAELTRAALEMAAPGLVRGWSENGPGPVTTVAAGMPPAAQ